MGGKGGVGKTTCAAGIAVTAAGRGDRVLVVSTDPASSLRDAFGLPRPRPSDTPRRVRSARGDLHILEIDAPRALERWLAPRRDLLERIALHGTWLDQDDVSRLLRLSLPGIDEVVALIEIGRLGHDTRFDTIVVDTAPTGHTLRMLAMPATLLAIARVFDRMQEKHRVMVDALRGAWIPDAADALIEELDRDARHLAALLRDPLRVRMSWVTLPEPMAIAEAADAVTQLVSEGIPLGSILVNRVTPRPPAPCDRCDARRAFEARAMTALDGIPGGAPRTSVTERDREPRTLTAFAAIGKEIEGAASASRGRHTRARRWEPELAPGAPVTALVDAATRLLIFGGKGGTGKTTCAAAAALEVASRMPSRRVLLLSTDPAHSLGDVLGQPMSDAVASVEGGPPNLGIRELDAARGFAAVRERYATAVDRFFDRISRTSAADARNDRAVMQGLIDLAPPGVDELAAVIEVTDALDAEGPAGADIIVMDTAPSGHALRLLEMPGLVQDWAKALMSIILKYQEVVGVGELGAMLLRLSKGLGRLRDLLADPARAQFVAVTRAAALPRAETARLVARLRAMRIHVRTVIVNAAGRGTCARCRTAAAAECREIAAVRHAVTPGRRHTLVATAPAQVPPPQGVVELSRWRERWRLREPPTRRATRMR